MKSPLLFNLASRVGYQWTMETDELKGHLKMPAGYLNKQSERGSAGWAATRVNVTGYRRDGFFLKQ